MGWMVVPKKVCPCPHPWNLWMVEGYLQMWLRILRSSWIIRVRPKSNDKWQREDTDRRAAMGRWRQRLKWFSHKPKNAKDGGQPPEAGRACGPADILISDFRSPELCGKSIYVLLRQEDCGSLYGSHRKPNHPPNPPFTWFSPIPEVQKNEIVTWVGKIRWAEK